ncbi:hypothetical protein [Chondromyces crocatus]|uniref:Uncharacterized protein n=1 Tax=Chondromyces crocatus TaxID=52 RepID=A0A0K1ECC7_CHOCO|nr:hypothetical protein [Chondromyces crocatus]AKT38218.1 uncharacterized protein CMC5_023610 [Chondromyces crocatus]
MATEGPSPNEDRGVVKNPNNMRHDKDLENREKQGHIQRPPPGKPEDPKQRPPGR